MLIGHVHLEVSTRWIFSYPLRVMNCAGSGFTPAHGPDAKMIRTASTLLTVRRFSYCPYNIRFHGVAISWMDKKPVVPEPPLHRAPAVPCAKVRVQSMGSATADAHQWAEFPTRNPKSRPMVSQDANFRCFLSVVCVRCKGGASSRLNNNDEQHTRYTTFTGLNPQRARRHGYV